MNLPDLQLMVSSLDSLAEIERQHPEIASRLLTFVHEIRDISFEAYQAVSAALRSVLLLPARPSIDQLERVSEDIEKTHGWNKGQWERRLIETCGRLESLLYDAVDTEKKSAPQVQSALKNLHKMLQLLHHGPDMVRDSVDEAMYEFDGLLGDAKTTGTSEELKKRALEVQQRIKTGVDQITTAVSRIEGSLPDGGGQLLRPDDIAEHALQRPERMLILSMFFLAFVFSLGAFAFQYLKLYQFVLITGFALTSVVVVNAFYLRTIDKLKEENFIKLMELALSKFFAPLIRGRHVGESKSPRKKSG